MKKFKEEGWKRERKSEYILESEGSCEYNLVNRSASPFSLSFRNRISSSSSLAIFYVFTWTCRPARYPSGKVDEMRAISQVGTLCGLVHS